MSKLFGIKALAAALAAGSIVGGVTAASAQETTWNFNIFGPPRAVTKGIETMAKLYEEASGGKLKLNIAYGAALGPERQIPEAIKSGGYEGGVVCVGYYPNKFPLLSVLELPFVTPPDIKAVAAVQEALFQQEDIRKEMEERWNLRYFAPAFLPAYEFMGNKKIASTADMKGVKMRISGLNAKALAEFGAVPTMVTAPEGYTALERGTIDSFGFPYSYTFGAYKLYEVSKYVTEGMAMNGFVCFIAVSLDAWNAIPQAWRDKWEEIHKQGTEALHAAYKEADDKWIPIFHEKLEVSQFPKSERDKLAAGAGAIWEDWVKEQEEAGRPGQKILDFVQAEVAKHQ
jgi:TRAP-type C4-dicarboxylate transport system substrate-binding protein